MAENTRQSEGAGIAAAPCANAAGAHIEGGAVGRPRVLGEADLKAADPNNIRPGREPERVWGGDRNDPRLFYFRALLRSGWFFSGVTRV